MTSFDAILTDLAAKAQTINPKKTRPGPQVAAGFFVDGKCLAEGLYTGRGTPHAEKKCLEALEKQFSGPKLAHVKQKGTLLITLEPCLARSDKQTPPCADFLVQKGIKRVVFGAKDPFYDGKSVLYLKKHDIDAQYVPNKASLRLITSFAHWQKHQRPYGVLKWAISAGGAVKSPQKTWFTSSSSQKKVHHARANAQCVLTSTQTILDDHPKLDIRHYTPPKGIFRTPPDVFVLGQRSLPPESPFLAVAERNVTFLKTKNLKKAIQMITKQGYTHFLAECGPKLGQALIKAGVIDELQLFVAPYFWLRASGTPFHAFVAQSLDTFTLFDTKTYENDVFLRFLR